MSELQAEHYETNEAALQDRDAPIVRRPSFTPLPEEAAMFSEFHKAPQTSVFEKLNQYDPFGARYVDTLLPGDVLHVPGPVYEYTTDDKGNDVEKKIPNTVRYNKLVVSTIDARSPIPKAIIVNDAGIEEEALNPDILVNDEDGYEAKIARKLLREDGIDLHDEALKVVDNESVNEESEQLYG